MSFKNIYGKVKNNYTSKRQEITSVGEDVEKREP